jgi:hypothetical protein
MGQADSDILPKKKRNEKAVKAEVKKLLAQHGWFCWMPPANMYGSTGASDFHALKDGVFLAIETKSNGGRLTENQRKFLVNVTDAECFGFVVDEARLGVLGEFLARFNRAALDARKNKMLNEDGARMLDCIALMTVELA